MDRDRTRQVCPCGCGGFLPEPLEVSAGDAGAIITQWVESQGLTMAQLKSANRDPQMVECRRRVSKYLRHHGWSMPAIGRFIDRDHTTVLHLLRGSPAA